MAFARCPRKPISWLACALLIPFAECASTSRACATLALVALILSRRMVTFNSAAASVSYASTPAGVFPYMEAVTGYCLRHEGPATGFVGFVVWYEPSVYNPTSLLGWAVFCNGAGLGRRTRSAGLTVPNGGGSYSAESPRVVVSKIHCFGDDVMIACRRAGGSGQGRHTDIASYRYTMMRSDCIAEIGFAC